MSSGTAHRRNEALVSLFIGRTVYAFNWYNIGAVLPLIRTGLAVDTAELGIVLAAFLIGAAIFQVPAGLAAMRWGNRTVAIGALWAMAAFTLASAASPNWVVLAATRFGAGAGAAFFFAPGLGLATSYFPAGTRGPVIGVYNSGFALGSAISLIAGAYIGLLFGWQWALAIGGFLLVGGAVLAATTLPRVADEGTGTRSHLADLWRSALPTVRSRELWALALGTSGLWAGFYIAAQYFVEYAIQVGRTSSLVLAAGVTFAMIVFEIPGGPIGGWFAERSRGLRRLILVWGVATAGAIAAIPLLSFPFVWLLFVFLGFANGVFFAVLYLIPTYLPGLRTTGFSFALALLNSIQIFVGSALALGFGFVAQRLGFTGAWWLAGAAAAVFLPLLILVPDTRTRPLPGTAPVE